MSTVAPGGNGAGNASGLHGLNVPRELGGMNAPLLLYFVNNELFARADVSVMAHHGFHGGTAMAMLVFSLYEGSTEFDGRGRIVKTRWETPIREIVSGRAWGSMDITEPDAGSDMAALRTVAELESEIDAQLGAAGGDARRLPVLTRRVAGLAQKEPATTAKLLRSWMAEGS